jgi:hypothetical protein
VSTTGEPPKWQIAPTLICAIVGLFLASILEPMGTPFAIPLVVIGQLAITILAFVRMFVHRRSRRSENDWIVYNGLLVWFPIIEVVVFFSVLGLYHGLS